MAGVHLWNHSWNQDWIRHPWKYPSALSQTTSSSSLISLWADTGLLSVTTEGFLDCYINRFIPLAPLAVFTQPDLMIAIPFIVSAPSLLWYQEVIPFYCWVVFQCLNYSQFLYPFICHGHLSCFQFLAIIK